MSRIAPLVFCTLFFVTSSSRIEAQQPPAGGSTAPVNAWTRTVSVGLALTAGNKDTSTFNAGFEAVYDPKHRNLLKADGLFFRGKTGGELTADRLGLNGRDEYKLNDGVFTFAQLQYLRDQFKDIQYLVAPTAGLGYLLAETPSTRASVDAGVGTVWERRRSQDNVQTSPVVNVNQKLTFKLSDSATITQVASALHRLDNLSDALYTLNVVLGASVTTSTQLKVELLDTFRNSVPPGIQKNDVAVLVGLVFRR